MIQMMVKTEPNGKRRWGFSIDEKLLYELLCNNVAWTMLRKSGKPVAEVEACTVQVVDEAPKDKTTEELAGISSEFIRAVFLERKRLGLTEYQLEDKEEEKDE